MLLDTNAFIWAAIEPGRLGAAERVVHDSRNVLLLSAVSSWEIAIKAGTGRLTLPDRAAVWVAREARTLGCTLVDIEHVHALAVEGLPRLHGDPFDRLLVAQAKLLKVPLVTADAALAGYGVEVIAADG